MTEATSAPEREFPGRTRIAPRALTRIVAAVTANAFRVDARRVDVDLHDDHGLLAITVATPARLLSLTRIAPGGDDVERDRETLIERSSRAQHTIRERVSALTGMNVGHVTIRLAGTDVRAERRVK